MAMKYFDKYIVWECLSRRMLGRMSVLTTQISRRSIKLRALEMFVHT
jgi:hypothetical protein